jgi:hypothetical protein
MSETIAPEKVEAVVISGPNRGQIIELPLEPGNRLTIGKPSDEELRLLNEALDQVLASFDRLEQQIQETTRAFKNRERH